MTQPIPIHEGRDFYVPAFQVTLRGRPLDQAVVRDVIRVEYSDDVEAPDSFSLTINNWDAEKRFFRYSDGELFLPGASLELDMGYFGGTGMRRLLTGEITGLSPSFPAGGQPALAVDGLNRLHRLREKQESRSYDGRTDSEIARQIAGRLGIPIRTEPSAERQEERYGHLFQDNQYDILFLLNRARSIGYELLVEENAAGEPRLFFGPSDQISPRPVYQLNYGDSLIEFQPTLTTANQVGEVVVRGWDRVRKRPIEGRAKRSELRTKGVGKRGGQPVIEESFNQRHEVIVDRPVNSRQEAKTLARETLERIAKDMVKGSGSVVGLPDLRAGSVLILDGLGTRFSGRYFVTKTTHSIDDGGYTTRFECRREEVEEG
jgi:phage protein D